MVVIVKSKVSKVKALLLIKNEQPPRVEDDPLEAPTSNSAVVIYESRSPIDADFIASEPKIWEESEALQYHIINHNNVHLVYSNLTTLEFDNSNCSIIKKSSLSLNM